MTNPFKMEHSTIQDTGLHNQLIQQFIAAHPEDDIIYGAVSLAMSKNKNPLLDVLAKVKSYLTYGRVVSPSDSNDFVITGLLDDKDVMVWVSVKYFDDVHRIKFEITANPDAVTKITAAIENDFHNEILPGIKWWFTGRHGDEIKEFYLPENTQKILPEFYPDLADPVQFLNDYMDSNEAVLLIGGPPGTGKTTLLRYLLSMRKLQAHIIFDENLMKKDTPFQDFLFGESNGRPSYVGGWADEERASDIMIIEDADTILTSRESDGNPLMSRFLNITDGLIKLPNKKLVFTTNIINFEKVDSAILRPGRCFGVLHTRALNLTEAQAAARVAGLPIPLEKREYSLAELFNQGKSQQVRSIGFGIRH